MSNANNTVLRVAGMTCGHCEMSVREELEELQDVQVVSIDRASGRVEITGREVSAAELKGAIETAGFEFQGLGA